MKTGIIYPILDQKGRRIGFQALGGDGSVRGSLIGIPGLRTFRRPTQELRAEEEVLKEASWQMGPSAEELARRNRMEIQENEWWKERNHGFASFGRY